MPTFLELLEEQKPTGQGTFLELLNAPEPIKTTEPTTAESTTATLPPTTTTTTTGPKFPTLKDLLFAPFGGEKAAEKIPEAAKQIEAKLPQPIREFQKEFQAGMEMKPEAIKKVGVGQSFASGLGFAAGLLPNVGMVEGPAQRAVQAAKQLAPKIAEEAPLLAEARSEGSILRGDAKKAAAMRTDVELSNKYPWKYNVGDKVETNKGNAIILERYFQDGKPRYTVYPPGKKGSYGYYYWIGEQDLGKPNFYTKDVVKTLLDKNIDNKQLNNLYYSLRDFNGDVSNVLSDKEKRLIDKFAKSQLTDIWNQAHGLRPGQASTELFTGAGPEPSKLSPAEQTIIDALKEAKPIRGKQEALYSEEKAKRVARMVEAGQKTPGEAGYFAQLGQLKGELPKVEFEGIRGKIDQTHVDELFQKVENSVLTPFEKVTAKGGLAKLLGAEGGRVPTKGELNLLSEVFPPEFMKAVMDKQPLMSKIWQGAGELLNLPRAMMATADLSAPLRQGIFLIGRPKQWLPAFRDMFKYAASEKAYQNLAKDIQARPTYQLMRESKLALTDLGESMTKREEAFMSNLSEKIPIFGNLARGSNRAYSGFLNKLRADTFDSMVRDAKAAGVLEKRPDVIHDIAKFVNSATGRGDIGNLTRASVILNGTFFSPRLMASRLNLLNPAYYVSLDPFVRKEALKALFAFAGTAGTVLTLAKLGGAQVGADPRSADFGKIKIGNTRLDVLGGFQQYIVLASRLLTNQMVSSTTGKQFTLGEGYKPTTRADIIQRFFESKASPVGSFILGLARGKGFGGDKLDVPVEVINRFIPMVASDMYDLYKSGGLPAMSLGVPGVFGVGSQTYSDPIPMESRSKTGKPTIKYQQVPGLAEDIVNKVRGVKVEPTPVKAVYDKVKELDAQGKGKEAQALVDNLSDDDYELYKKFRQRDQRIKTDETRMRVEPLYKKVKELDAQGRGDEAQKIVDDMTDEEYQAYQYLKSLDWRNLQ